MNKLMRYATRLSLAGAVAVILTVGPAQAFHKGFVHGGSTEDPIVIQTLDNLPCNDINPFAKWTGSGWICDSAIGAQGDTGDQGAQGAPGVKGDTGDQGAQGAPGVKGDTGEQGTAGTDTLGDLSCDPGDIVVLLPDDKWDCMALADFLGPKIVFISSSKHTGNLGGLTGADGICNTLAADAELDGTYKAWLATSVTSPASTFFKSAFSYRLPSGVVVAADWADLTDDSIAAPIDEDEDGDWVDSTYVWTGVLSDGATLASDTCGDWLLEGETSGGIGSNRAYPVDADTYQG